jgi:hypothetical protein
LFLFDSSHKNSFARTVIHGVLGERTVVIAGVGIGAARRDNQGQGETKRCKEYTKIAAENAGRGFAYPGHQEASGRMEKSGNQGLATWPLDARSIWVTERMVPASYVSPALIRNLKT